MTSTPFATSLKTETSSENPQPIRNLGLEGESAQRLHALLNALPVAIYTTDLDGRITFYNNAAVALWAHKPALGSDQWCGSWRLYWPDGKYLPHDECPMAIALKHGSDMSGKEAVAERPDGTRVPFMAFPSRVHDANGHMIGAINMLVDISDRKRAELALRENEERFRALVDASAQMVWTTDANGVVNEDSPSWRAFTGQTVEQWKGSDRSAAIHPDDRERVTPLWREALASKTPFNAEYRVRRHDGEWRWTAVRAVPLGDDAKGARGWVGMNWDITDLKRVESESQKFTAIVESSDDAIISKSLDGIIATWNKGAERIFGYRADEVIGQPIYILIPEERHNEEPSIVERIRSGQRIDHYETIRRRKDGSLVELSLTVSPVKNSRGEIIGASKIARDITERKRAEERANLLSREVDHRAKNLLAIVQATVNLTRADTAQEFKKSLSGRLQAIANAHTLFSESHWYGADLHTLVSQELAPYRGASRNRVEIKGTPLSLKPDAAQSMAIALHELATNALKYGALSLPDGHVDVAWSRTSEGTFKFLWRETGVPSLAPPQHRGFGTRVIEQMVRGQGGGGVCFDWQPGGLVCEIMMGGVNLPPE